MFQRIGVLILAAGFFCSSGFFPETVSARSGDIWALAPLMRGNESGKADSWLRPFLGKDGAFEVLRKGMGHIIDRVARGRFDDPMQSRIDLGLLVESALSSGLSAHVHRNNAVFEVRGSDPDRVTAFVSRFLDEGLDLSGLPADVRYKIHSIRPYTLVLTGKTPFDSDAFLNSVVGILEQRYQIVDPEGDVLWQDALSAAGFVNVIVSRGLRLDARRDATLAKLLEMNPELKVKYERYEAGDPRYGPGEFIQGLIKYLPKLVGDQTRARLTAPGMPVSGMLKGDKMESSRYGAREVCAPAAALESVLPPTQAEPRPGSRLWAADEETAARLAQKLPAQTGRADARSLDKKKTILFALSGGDCAGPNPALAAFVRRLNAEGYEVAAAVHGFKALLADPAVLDDYLVRVTPELLDRGLGELSSVFSGSSRSAIDAKSAETAVKNAERFAGVFIIGGDDHARQGAVLAQHIREQGFSTPVVSAFKSIDRDVYMAEMLGFESGRAMAYELYGAAALSAAVEGRSTVYEVMGRDAGWLALFAGSQRNAALAAHSITLVPEKPFDSREFLIEAMRRMRAETGPDQLFGYVSVMCSEGVKLNSEKDPVLERLLALDPVLKVKYAQDANKELDTHGNPKLAGTSEYIEGLLSYLPALAASDPELGAEFEKLLEAFGKRGLKTEEYFSAGRYLRVGGINPAYALRAAPVTGGEQLYAEAIGGAAADLMVKLLGGQKVTAVTDDEGGSAELDSGLIVALPKLPDFEIMMPEPGVFSAVYFAKDQTRPVTETKFRKGHPPYGEGPWNLLRGFWWPGIEVERAA